MSDKFEIINHLDRSFYFSLLSGKNNYTTLNQLYFVKPLRGILSFGVTFATILNLLRRNFRVADKVL